MKSAQNWTIPNFLSAYRLVVFPLGMYYIFNGKEDYFAILLCINLATDILDGFIARRFNMETALGARLDSIADIGTYILAFLGVYFFKWSSFEPHALSLGLFFTLFVSANMLALLKFGKTASLHLYSSKIGGYLQGVFFFVLFVWGFNTSFYYIMITWGIVSFVEHISIQIYLNKMISNVKGWYWIWTDKNHPVSLK